MCKPEKTESRFSAVECICYVLEEQSEPIHLHRRFHQESPEILPQLFVHISRSWQNGLHAYSESQNHREHDCQKGGQVSNHITQHYDIGSKWGEHDEIEQNSEEAHYQANGICDIRKMVGVKRANHFQLWDTNPKPWQKKGNNAQVTEVGLASKILGNSPSNWPVTREELIYLFYHISNCIGECSVFSLVNSFEALTGHHEISEECHDEGVNNEIGPKFGNGRVVESREFCSCGKAAEHK